MVLYKSRVALVRAYANISGDMPQAGYTSAGIAQIKRDIDGYLKLREIIRQASGEAELSQGVVELADRKTPLPHGSFG